MNNCLHAAPLLILSGATLEYDSLFFFIDERIEVVIHMDLSKFQVRRRSLPGITAGARCSGAPRKGTTSPDQRHCRLAEPFDGRLGGASHS